MKKVILSTKNKSKVKEFNELMSKYGYNVVSRDEAGVPDVEIVEDGETFEENSFKKANEIMKLAGEITVADDSGLMVDALDGAPGVYSARFAGGRDDDENNEKVLELMKDVPQEQRGAKFVCVITMCSPDGSVVVARGECHGSIGYEVRGTNGFGYDSIFIPDGFDRTFAEFSSEAKNSMSHRARALAALEAKLEK